MTDLIPHDPDARLIGWLASGGLRPTRQRLALAALLVGDGEDRHVTAEGLYAAAAGTADKVSLATVYNTLRAFCSAGLMQEVVVDGDFMLMYSASLEVTIGPLVQGLRSAMRSGEGFVYKMRGSGSVWVTPSARIA